jgi:hypothetical protein
MCFPSGDPRVNVDRVLAAEGGRVPALDRPARLGLVVAGSIGLVLVVLGGAAAQAGVTQCAVCAGNVCGPGTEVCPGSVALLVFFVALLATACSLIAVGLSGWTARTRAGNTKQSEDRPNSPTDLDLIAPLLLFFGWGLLALGLLLPWDIFGFCHEPCEYAYVLSGYPLALVIGGAVILTSGAFLLTLIGIRRRRRFPR